jgi:hypothetical protein
MRWAGQGGSDSGRFHFLNDYAHDRSSLYLGWSVIGPWLVLRWPRTFFTLGPINPRWWEAIHHVAGFASGDRRAGAEGVFWSQ